MKLSKKKIKLILKEIGNYIIINWPYILFFIFIGYLLICWLNVNASHHLGYSDKLPFWNIFNLF